MGMAASQARLLFITARLHDVELRAQQLLAQKIALATQQDAAWSKYNEAIDASVVTANTINMSNGSGQTTIGTFNNLTSPTTFANAGGMRFGIVDTTGKDAALYLSPDHQKLYEQYKTSHPDGGDEDSFAIHMMGLSEKINKENIIAEEQRVYESKKSEELTKLAEDKETGIIPFLQKCYDDNEKAEKDAKWEVAHKDWEDKYADWTEEDDPKDPEPIKGKGEYAYEEYTVTGVYDTAFKNGLTKEQRAQYEPMIEKFSELARSLFTEENYENLVKEEAFDDNTYDYYCDMWQQIQELGGNTKAMNPNYMNNAEWLTNAVKNGSAQIWKFDSEGNKWGEEEFTFEPDSPSSSSSLSYTPTTEIDKEAQKKAEAEYEYTLKQIDNKEKKIDIELSKLETERNALTTEYDSVKKVIEDNVERTFGIFS